MLSRLTSCLPLSLLTSIVAVGATSTADAQVAVAPSPYTPIHAWSFDDGYGAHGAHDSAGGVDGTGGSGALFIAGQTTAFGAAHDKVAFLFPQTGYDEQNAYVDFGAAVGTFGAGDFTVTHAFATAYNVAPGAVTSVGTFGDVLGNRTSPGHGNFFAIRMRGDGVITCELDQDASGTNYIGFSGEGYPVNDGKLHHLAYVRLGPTLSLYIDGVFVASGRTASGQPTLVTGADTFRIGRRAPFSFVSIPAMYDDLKIYPLALSAQQIQAEAAGSP